MTTLQRNGIAAAIALSMLLIAGTASAQKVRFNNNSDWVIVHLYLSPTGIDTWGPDQLGEYVLQPGYFFDLPAACGTYDIGLVDEDGDECVVASRYICNEPIDISSDDLIACQVITGVDGAVE